MGLALLVFLSVFIMLWSHVTPANAQETITFDVEVPQGTQVIEGPAGSTHPFSAPVPSNAVGLTCTAIDIADNNASVHLGNNIILTSAGGQIVMRNVEREPGVTTSGEGTLVLGTEITATIVLSPEPNWYDRSIFSGVHIVRVTCELPPPETTTTTTSTTVPPTTSTTVPPTTTTEPPETTTTTEPPPETTTTTTPPTTTQPPPTTTQPPESEVEEVCISDDEGNNWIVTIVDGEETDRQPALACTGPNDSDGDYQSFLLNLGAYALAGFIIGLFAVLATRGRGKQVIHDGNDATTN